jgi:hypothetical protein
VQALGGRNGRAAGSNGHAATDRVRRSLLTRLASATAPTDSARRRRLACGVRRDAVAARERRLAGGVIVFADVRAEQARLDRLATLVELGKVRPPAALDLVEHVLTARATPVQKAMALTAIFEAFEHDAGRWEIAPAERQS